MASRSQSQLLPLSLSQDDDDDDFQITPLTLTSHNRRPSKKPKNLSHVAPGKENTCPDTQTCSLDCIQSSIGGSGFSDGFKEKGEKGEKGSGLRADKGYLCNSIEGRLLGLGGEAKREDEFVAADESDDELDVMLKLCSECCSVDCPLCGADISGLSEEERQLHTNHCLDKAEQDESQQLMQISPRRNENSSSFIEESIDDPVQSPRQVGDVSPVLKWLRNLGLAKYEDAFVREEIDWATLQWLTEEDLLNIGITALGPRKKIVHALSELRKGRVSARESQAQLSSGSTRVTEAHNERSTASVTDTRKPAANKLITEFFPGLVTAGKRIQTTSKGQQMSEMAPSDSGGKHAAKRNIKNGKLKAIPPWCCIPGTPFRVDAFKFLRGDCCHWLLTHFHLDHYQGLTRSFCHGKIYCSSITAKLVNMKIGIPWDRLQVLPLNQKTNIAGINVTCFDANHCPGSIIILFEPPNGKAILHTGDFRYSEEMASAFNRYSIHTLILDTTYCNPQYDFPKQEAVIQFVIEAIQAESFNPKTLFLIGSYTIGKERLFLEVARVLRKKVYINAAKLRLLECLGFSKEDMQWFTINEKESHIHVVPMWTLASFKRLKYIANQYASRFSLMVAFSPTGWTFGKGKKKSSGRRWQQGTIIRYEVPYSEHSSFTELKEFVKVVSPENILPSVNNEGPDSAAAMVSLLLS